MKFSTPSKVNEITPERGGGKKREKRKENRTIRALKDIVPHCTSASTTAAKQRISQEGAANSEKGRINEPRLKQRGHFV